MTTDLIIDTDVALGVWHEGRPRDIDDGFAIIEALNSPALNLIGITTVFGNGPQAEVHRVAQELVALKGSPTPVIAGAPEPLSSHHNDNELTTNPAVEFLAEQLRRKPMAVAAIGPLTNLGLLALRYPAAAQNITQLIIVAGRSPGQSFYIGDAGPVQDFNFENDVRAAKAVLDHCPNVVLAGFELTSQVCVTRTDLEAIRAVATETAQYLYENSLAWCDHWTKTFPTDAGFHPWDSAAISWLKHPEFFSAEQRGCQVQPATDERPAWLICGPSTNGPRHTYLQGFSPGGAVAFVNDVVTSVH